MVTLEVGLDAQGLISGASTSAGALSSLTGAAMTMNMALQGSTAATTAFGVALSTAMPWLAAIGGALAGAAAMMGVWASSTREATSAWNGLSTAMDKALASQQAASSLGMGQGGALGAQRQALWQGLVESQKIGAKPISFGELQSATRGVLTQEELIGQLAASGAAPQSILQFGRNQEFGTGVFAGGQNVRHEIMSSDPSGIMIPPSAAAQALRQGYSRMGMTNVSGAPGSAPMGGGIEGGPGLPPDYRSGFETMGTGVFGPPGGTPFGAGGGVYGPGRAEFNKAQQDEKLRNERESLQNLMEMQQLANEIGSTLGNAAADFALGLRDGKSALAGIASQFSRMLITKGMTQATNWAFTTGE